MAARSVASVRGNRWVILAGFALLTACTQLLWLAYAPITTQVHQLMGVSEGAVGDLAGIFPLVYVILALPAGRWLDVRFERALGLGAVLDRRRRAAAPGRPDFVRLGDRRPVRDRGRPAVRAQLDHQGRRPVLPGQGADRRPSRLAAWPCSRAFSPPCCRAGRCSDAGGLTLLLRVQAAIAVVAALWVLAAIRAPAMFPGDPSVAVSLRWLRGDRFVWLLGGLLFVGMGVFNAVATWLDSILTHFGHGGASGALVAIMTVGGIAGGALLPGIVAET